MDQSTELTVGRPTGLQRAGSSIFLSTPKETVAFATELANVLKPVIEGQGMYSLIQGKKHVKVEGWLTLGAMLGILPRETGVTELPDGSFEAHVDLVNSATGTVVGGASAICGIEEKRWANAERYARRSMAVTRATVKSYRIAFSWIIQLAGYSPTPEEEMPVEGATQLYNHRSEADRAWIKAKLVGTDIPEPRRQAFAEGFHEQPRTDMVFEVAVAKFVHGD